MQTSVVPKQRSCFKCGFNEVIAETKCPKCSRVLHTATSIRVRGLLLLLCGSMLIGLMAYLSVWAVGAFTNNGTAGARFTGTHREMMMIVGLFAALFLFGLASFITGLWQVIVGTRNRMLIWSVSLVAVVVFVAVAAVIFLFD